MTIREAKRNIKFIQSHLKSGDITVTEIAEIEGEEGKTTAVYYSANGKDYMYTFRRLKKRASKRLA